MHYEDFVFSKTINRNKCSANFRLCVVYIELLNTSAPWPGNNIYFTKLCEAYISLFPSL